MRSVADIIRARERKRATLRLLGISLVAFCLFGGPLARSADPKALEERSESSLRGLREVNSGALSDDVLLPEGNKEARVIASFEDLYESEEAKETRSVDDKISAKKSSGNLRATST
jgi:hypothetical protein